MVEDEVLVDSKTLQTFLAELFENTGQSEEDAIFLSQKLVESNLMGVDSHGVMRVPIYVKRLRSRAVNPKPQTRIIRGSKGLEVLDGDNGLGFITGREAMKRAIQLASQFNVGIVGAIRSNHFGAAGLYTCMAADEGMIGVATTNVAPNMAISGASKPIIGNNPIAVAVPTFGAFPVVLDLALSVVAGGKLFLASKKGEKIPLDWALDSDGRPTDDPDKGVKGILLPVGGHKGFGLALMVDILCGVVTGGSFLHQLKAMYKYPDDPSETCHLMAAINLSAIMGNDEMKKRMASFCDTVKSAPTADKSTEILLPGELEHRMLLKRKIKGIPLPANLYNELADLGHEMGVASPLSPIT